MWPSPRETKQSSEVFISRYENGVEIVFRDGEALTGFTLCE